MFTIATSALNLASIPTGAILDRYGPRLTAIGAGGLVTLGCLLFAQGGSGIWQSLYLIGFLAMALGGPPVFISALSFPNLFPGKEGLVTAALVGCFDASSGVFVFLAYIINNTGMSFLKTFTGYSAIGLLTALGASWLWPNSSIDVVAAVPGSFEQRRRYPSLAGLSLRQQLVCIEYWLCVLAVSITMLSINFYIATVNEQVYLVDPDDISKLVNTFTAILPLGGIVYAPVVGMVADRLSMISSWLILWAAMLTFAGLNFAYAAEGSAALAYAAFAVFAFCRPLLYTMAAAFIGQVFGFANFGKLYGLVFTVAGAVNLCVRGLHWVALTYSYQTANMVMIVLQTSTVVFPLVLAFRRRGNEARSLEPQGNAESGACPKL